MEDEAAIAQLVKIKGVGRWTAEVYLLFAHGRRDIWPIDDLGLIVGMQRLKGLRKRPDRKRMLRLAEPWRPWRGAAAHLLWHYFHKTTEIARAPMEDAPG
jgi:DNA-3-methyladenine glycosylase II